MSLTLAEPQAYLGATPATIRTPSAADRHHAEVPPHHHTTSSVSPHPWLLARTSTSATGLPTGTAPRPRAVTTRERTLLRAQCLGPIGRSGQLGLLDGWTRPIVPGRWSLGAQYCARVLKFPFQFKNFHKIIQTSKTHRKL
jgi:hypothetical protein